MKGRLQFETPEAAKLHNIVDMGLSYSAMIRLFERGSKGKLRDRILAEVQRIYRAESENQYCSIHSDFCKWGMSKIKLAKSGEAASYGQIAKTFDVVLKVVIYYCQLPDSARSLKISKWLNAAVDTRMMAWLKERYPEDLESWPTTITQVKKQSTYASIQETVRKHIKYVEARDGKRIIPVEFDDICWMALNR